MGGLSNAAAQKAAKEAAEKAAKEVAEKAAKEAAEKAAKEAAEKTAKEAAEKAAKEAAEKTAKEAAQKTAKEAAIKAAKAAAVLGVALPVLSGFTEAEKVRCACKDANGNSVGDKYPTQEECEAVEGNAWSDVSTLDAATCLLNDVGNAASDLGGAGVNTADAFTSLLKGFNALVEGIAENKVAIAGVSVTIVLLIFASRMKLFSSAKPTPPPSRME